MTLTRRQLLARAGGAGAALLLGSHAPTAGAAPAPPAAAAPPAPRMLKGVSLIGDVNPYDDSLGVRPYLLGGRRPADVVSLWISWRPAQPFRPEPQTLERSFAELSDPAGPAAAALTALDAQIAQANADGRRVALTFYQSFPEWSHPSTGCLMPAMDPTLGGPGYPGQGRLPNDGRLPDDLSEDGPWAWFVAYCCARWSDTGGAATPGPGRGGASVGNPRGGHVDWLAPLNEPNLAWWPQTSELFPGGTIDGVVAQLMRTAAAVAARYRNAAGSPNGPELLMPGTADVVAEDAPRGTPWRAFTSALLRRLDGWRPETPVGWSQHNYADVKHGPQRDGRWRAEEAIDLLHAAGWPDPSLWLTEGGYQFGVRQDGPDPGRWLVDPHATADPASPDVFAEQVARLQANWDAMARLPVRLWSQYQVNDRDVRFQSSLRGPVRDRPDGSRALNEPPYPAYALWPDLGA